MEDQTRDPILSVRKHFNTGIRDIAAYLMMRQSDRSQHLCRHGQDIPQHVDLQLVKSLVDRGLEQRLQLVQAILDL
jgi:hypothetical protein